MNLRNRWLRLIGKLRKPVWHPTATMPTELLFTEPNGMKNFRFVDLDHTGGLRLLKLEAVKEEMEQRVTRDFLKGHTTMMAKLLDSGKLGDAAILNRYLTERLDHVAPDGLLIYKFAAIASFDESEDPRDVDLTYVNRKIERWERQGISPFFLSQSLSMYAGASTEYAENFPRYLKAATIVAQRQSAYLTLLLSSEESAGRLVELLTWEEERLKAMLQHEDLATVS